MLGRFTYHQKAEPVSLQDGVSKVTNPSGNVLRISSNWTTRPMATKTVAVSANTNYTLQFKIDTFSTASNLTHNIRVRVIIPGGTTITQVYTTTGTKTINFTSVNAGNITFEILSQMTGSGSYPTASFSNPLIDIDNFNVTYTTTTTTTSTVCSIFDKGYRYGPAELRDNGMEKDNEINVNGGDYDFGARIYDSRLGRWLSLDPLMAEYVSLSPYCGMGNNPILIVDPDGRKLIIDNGGVLLEYRDGKLYSLDEVDENGNYCKEYTQGEGEYAKKALDNLILLTSTPTGFKMINDIVVNQKVITIKPSQIVDKKYLNDAHKNGIIYTDFNSTNELPTKKGYKKTPAFIILGHECAHAISFLNNKINYVWVSNKDDEGNDNSYGIDEIYATHIENKLRQENDLPLRTHYTEDGQSDLLEGNTSKYVKIKIGVIKKPKEITKTVKIYNSVTGKFDIKIKFKFIIMVEENVYRNYDYVKDENNKDVVEEEIIINDK